MKTNHIGMLQMLSCMLLVFGGGLVVSTYVGTGLVLIAVGAGWNGIVFATYQRGMEGLNREKTAHAARTAGKRQDDLGDGPTGPN